MATSATEAGVPLMAPPPHALRDVDFFREPDGSVGIAWVTRREDVDYMALFDMPATPGAIHLEPLDEYLERRLGANKGKESRAWESYYEALGFVRPEQCPWPLPDKPEMDLKAWEDAEGLSLLDSIAQFFGEHVRLRGEDEPRGVAAWILASSIPEVAMYAPPLIFTGVPGAGKSRAIRATYLIVRRGLPLNVPSAASLYALADAYKPTLTIDEWGNLSDEVRRPVETIIRAGFARGGKIPRRKDHSEGVRFYDAFCFFALASRVPLPDDVVDRGYPFYMIENRGVPDLPESASDARELRTAILRFRLEALSMHYRSQLSDLTPFHRAPAPGVRVLVRDAAVKAGRSLPDRGLDKGEALAGVALPFDAFDDVVSMIVLAQERGRDTFANTLEALIYRGLQRVAPEVRVPGIHPKPTLKEVHDAAWDVARDEGMTLHELEMRDPVAPKILAPAIRMLGFPTKLVHGVTVVDNPEFWSTMDRLETKYGGDSATPIYRPLPTSTTPLESGERWVELGRDGSRRVDAVEDPVQGPLDETTPHLGTSDAAIGPGEAVLLMQAILRGLCDGGRSVSGAEILRAAQGRGIGPDRARSILQHMKSQGDVYEPVAGTFRLTSTLDRGSP